MLDVSNSTLKLNAGLSVAGTLKTDNTTTLTLNNNALNLSGGSAAAGGLLEVKGALTLDGITFDNKTTIKLNDNTTLTSNAALTVKTIEMGTHILSLGSATTDLTISDNITINYSGHNGIHSGAADLTLNGPVNVLMGGIISTGGTVTFGAGANGTSFAEGETGMIMDNTSLVLQTDLDVEYLQLSGTSTLQTNGKKLRPRDFEIGIQTELDFTDIVTDNDSSLYLLDNSSITKNGAILFNRISTNGHTLTLNSAITRLKAENIYLTDNDNSSSSTSNTGKLVAQGVDVTSTNILWVDNGTIEMGGGTLTLEKGGGLGNGEIDLSNSTLELAGPFINDGGTLTTSASTLRLKANVLFLLGNAVTFNTYVPNGWGLLLYNSDNSSSTKSLTLGTNNSNITLEPSTNSLTSGFVRWYHDNNTEYVSGNHDIGIESDNGSLTINGNLTLRDNATITLNYGEAALGNLTLENGSIVANKATLSLAGGTVGTNGKINVGNESELELQGGLSVAGVLNLDNESIFNLAGNTLDLSGGKFSTDDDLSLAGTLSITGDSELTVSQGHTLTLSQAGGLALDRKSTR